MGVCLLFFLGLCGGLGGGGGGGVGGGGGGGGGMSHVHNPVTVLTFPEASTVFCSFFAACFLLTYNLDYTQYKEKALRATL